MYKLKIALPKGRIFEKVKKLFEDCEIKINVGERDYKPTVSVPDFAVKIMKPQNIPSLVELGSHDIGFTGKDWIVETGADVEILYNLKFDPVKIVAAIPEWLNFENLKNKQVIVASEYEKISKKWLREKKIDYIFLKTYGATEVFPPEDADLIVDNTATGKTLKQNRLKIVETIMESSTVFIANKKALKDPTKQKRINDLLHLFNSVLTARKKVILEMNVPEQKLQEVINILPAMRAPTVSPLFGESGFAVKVAVEKEIVPDLLIKLKNKGARDILEYSINKVLI